MDDFEYSVQISEQDWDSFFQECEECNLLPPVLAGMEDSGMSDMDDVASHRALMGTEHTVPDTELQTDIPDHESPVDLYLSRYGMTSPMQVLSGSEDDLHMESVNVFFEKLKNVSVGENTSMKGEQSYVRSEYSGHLEEARGAKVKTVPFKIIQPTRSQAVQRNESIQKSDSCNHTANYADVKTHMNTCLSTELVINEEARSMGQMMKETKWEIEGKSADQCKDMRCKSDIENISCCAKYLAGPNQEKKEDSEVFTANNSDLLDSQSTSSNTPRRKRRKKKRISTDPMEPDNEVQFKSKHSESDDDIFVRRKEADRQIVSEMASSSQSLLLPKTDSILISDPEHSQSLPEKVKEPVETILDSTINHESLKSPSPSAQNREKCFVHEKTDLVKELASTGQFILTLNLTSPGIDVSVKKTGSLIIQSVDSTSEATNGDNVRCHLQLNSHLTDIKAALKASEALPASITTSDAVKIESQATGGDENPKLLYSEDHSGNSQVNMPASLLLSDPAVCSQEPNSQVGETATLSGCQYERSCAVCGRGISAEEKQKLTCATHEKVLPAHRDSHDFLSKESLSETLDPNLVTQSFPVNIGKAQAVLQNDLMNVNDPQRQEQQNLSAYTTRNIFSTETNSVIKNGLLEKVVISNGSMNSTLPSHLQNNEWKDEISSLLQSKDISNSSGSTEDTNLNEVKTAAKDRNEGQSLTEQTKKSETVTQITVPESQLKNSKQTKIIISGEEEESQVLYEPPHCSSEDHELSPSTITQGMTSLIPESMNGAEHTSSNITADADKSEAHHVPIYCPSKYHELTTGLIKQTMVSALLESMDSAEHVLSNIITPVEEEKGKVHNVPPQCQSNDDNLLPSVMMKSTAFPIPEPIDGIQGTASEKDRFSLQLQSENRTEEISQSIRSNDLPSSPGNDNGMGMNNVQSLSSAAEYNNEGESLKKLTKKCEVHNSSLRDHEFLPIAITKATPETMDENHAKSNNTSDKEKIKVHIEQAQLLEDHLVLSNETNQSIVVKSAENALSNISDPVEEEKDKACDLHLTFLSKDDKLSPTAKMKSSEFPIPEAIHGIKGTENENDFSLQLQSKEWTEEISTSIRSNDLANDNDMHMNNEESLSSATADRNEGEFLNKQTKQCEVHDIPLHSSSNVLSPIPVIKATSETMDDKHATSTVISSGDEEKSKVHIEAVFAPVEEEKGPPKDHNLSPSAKMHVIASPAPVLVDKVISMDSENDTFSSKLQSEDWAKKISPSMRSSVISNSLRNENEKSMKHVEILSSVAKDRNEGQSLEEQIRECQPLSSPERSQHEEPSNSKHILSICTAGEEKIGDVPPCCPPNHHELAPTVLLQTIASPIPETMDGTEHYPSNDIDTCDEEKGKVDSILPDCQTKDHALSSNEVMQDVVSSTPKSMDKVEHVSSSIIIPLNEEKAKVHSVPFHSASKDNELSHSVALKGASAILEPLEIQNSQLSLHSQNEEWTEDMFPLLSSKDVNSPEHKQSSPEQCFEEQTIKCPLIQVSGPESPLVEDIKSENTPSTIFTTSDKEKCPPDCLPKKHELSSNEVMQDIVFPTPESMDGVEPVLSSITTPVDEEKDKVHSVPLHSASKDDELSHREALKGASSMLEPLGMKTSTLSLEECTKDMIPSPTSQTIDGIEYPKSNNITIGDGEKDKVHNISPQSKDYELSPTEMMDDSAHPTAESMDGAKSTGTVSQPARPVYAISSFWNEMEKLTINDILRLRLVDQAQHPSVLLQPEESGIVDISDAADSGYFTHLDDSRPDRSSGDMSFISDFDEELAHLQTQDVAKLDEGSWESPADVMWESDPDQTGISSRLEDVIMLSSETPPLYRDDAEQCFRKMCKNISVQNLQALEAQPFRKILRNASLLSIHSVHSTHSIQVEDDYVDPFDQVDASSPASLSDDEEEESSGITFSEIIQYLFGSDEPEHSASAADNTTASYLDGTGTSVPESYDHFFSEFEGGSFFNLLADDSSSSKDEMVPIFSCSRSANRNLQFPEVYDYFFPDDSPVHSDEDEEHDHTAIRVITRNDHTEAKSDNAVAETNTYEELSSETSYSWNFLRNNPLSFRRVRRTGFTAPPEKSSSWAVTPVKNSGRSVQRGIQPINVMGPNERLFPDQLILGLENRIFMKLADQQKIRNEMQTVVADPRLDAPLMPLKQADMCLVCIAFASWVLKSANPQGADMWKAALLANISALSAIRYLRRYMRDEAAKKTPLRQIEPA